MGPVISPKQVGISRTRAWAEGDPERQVADCHPSFALRWDESVFDNFEPKAAVKRYGFIVVSYEQGYMCEVWQCEQVKPKATCESKVSNLRQMRPVIEWKAEGG